MEPPNPMTSDSTQWLGPGFTPNNAAAFAFKRGLSRGNTSLEANYYQEPVAKPTLFQEWIPSSPVPAAVPTDFTALTDGQISSLFGVTTAEIDAWRTTLDGSPAFSIERSASHPYLFKVNNCCLTPYTSNPQASYWANTATTNVNLLQSAIPFTYGTGAYRGVVTRTTPSGGTGPFPLSADGADVVLSQQLAYVFDCDTGIFTAYQDDTSPTALSPITRLTPPAITCYLYKGTYGNFTNPEDLVWAANTTAAYLTNPSLQVLIGTQTSTDPALILDVSGAAFITEIVTQSLTTSSDRRLKENIRPFVMPKGILNLMPRLYNYIAKPGATELGLIAQEVEEYVPELVKESGGMKSLQYDRLGVLLLPIVKDQEERIRVLEAEMAEMRELMAMLLVGKHGTAFKRATVAR